MRSNCSDLNRSRIFTTVQCLKPTDRYPHTLLLFHHEQPHCTPTGRRIHTVAASQTRESTVHNQLASLPLDHKSDLRAASVRSVARLYLQRTWATVPVRLKQAILPITIRTASGEKSQLHLRNTTHVLLVTIELLKSKNPHR